MNQFYETKLTVPKPKFAPPNGTLANLPTIFYSGFREFTQGTDITLSNVRLKFTPTTYRWNFGDGNSLSTNNPGKPYDARIVNRVEDIERNYTNIHRYDATGNYRVTLTVTVTGKYSVDGGPWRDIPGSLQATSPPTTIVVAEARGEFVTGNN